MMSNRVKNGLVIDEIRQLHRPFRIYDECGHKHEEGEPGVKEIDEVGLVCEAGFQYEICRACCVDSHLDEMTETCATEHTHGANTPRCATIAIIEKERA